MPEFWEYLLLVLFGAIVVGVHAHSLYGQRVPDPAAENNGDPLSSLALPVILGPSDYRRGFAVYLLATESLYLVLATSSTILGLTLEIIGHQNMVGALNEDLSPNLLYPVVASSLVILMSQARPTSGIERAFRRLSHSMAGVPRNLEEVQGRIRQQSLSFDSDDKLVQMSDKSSSHVSSFLPDNELSILDKHNFRKSLTRVHCLYNWTLGYDGEAIWVSARSRQITSLFQSLHLEYQTLTAELNSIALSATSTADQKIPRADAERWRTLIRATQLLEQRLTTVLSLLLINQPDADVKHAKALKSMRDTVLKKPSGQQSISSVVGQTLLLALPIIFFLATCVESLFFLWRRITNSRAAANLEFPFSSDLSFISRLWQVPEQFLMSSDKLVFIANRTDNALISTVDYVLIFGISALIALFIRKSQIDMRRWHACDTDGTPEIYPAVTSYLHIGLIAYLSSAVVFLLWKFLVHNIVNPLQAGIPVQISVTIRSFATYLPDSFLEPLTAFVCVWFILQHADHERWKSGIQLPTALLFTALCVAIVLLQNLIRSDFPADTSFANKTLSPFFGYCPSFLMFAYIYNRRNPRHSKTEKVQAFPESPSHSSSKSSTKSQYASGTQSRRRSNEGVDA